MGKIEEIISPQESLAEANKLKEAGNEAFKLERFEDALDCYTKAIELEREETKE